MTKIMACFLPRLLPSKPRAIEFNGGKEMSDLISYALLAGIFVITGLRMLVEKPKKLTETEAMHRQSSDGNEDF
jgi:hypothetical protein